MDEKVATRVCDLRAQAVAGHSSDAPLPMYLIVVSGGIPGAMLRLSSGGTRIGRAADNTFQLQEFCVSRHHAVFRTDPGGGVWLTDLASTNGTFVNGRRLPCHSPARLKDGDRIQFGSSVMVKYVRLEPSDEQFQREMFERTVRDALTGLYNRAYFLNQVGPLSELSAQRGLGLAILMLDLDHFKAINDTHGHGAGDLVLREVAGVLRDATRSEDLVARYGGEEFILALPVSALDQATGRAERIRSVLSTRRIAAASGSLRITASLGLAYAPPDWSSPVTSLITTADQCLYRAKSAGRNRVVCDQDTLTMCRESITQSSVGVIATPV